MLSLQIIQKLCTRPCSETFSFHYLHTYQPNWVMNLKQVVRCPQDTQCTARLRSNRKTMEYAPQDYRNLHWNIGAHNSQTGTIRREYVTPFPGRRHSDANVFQLLERSLRGRGRVALNVACGPYGHHSSKYAIIAAVERMPLKSLGRITREMGLSELMILGVPNKTVSVPQLTDLKNVSKRSPITDAAFRMTTSSTRCGWAVF
jgi:hypothetical protein